VSLVIPSGVKPFQVLLSDFGAGDEYFHIVFIAQAFI